MKIKLILLLILTTTLAFSQVLRKNTLGFSTGKTFFGTGDIRGYNITGKYERHLNKTIAIQMQLALALGNTYREADIPNNPYTTRYYNSTSQKINAGFLITLLNHKSHLFGINALLSGLKSVKFRQSGYSLNPSKNPPIHLVYLPTPAYYEKGYSIGGGIGLEYKYQLKRLLQLGAEINFKSYANGDMENNLNLGVYHSF